MFIIDLQVTEGFYVPTSTEHKIKFLVSSVKVQYQMRFVTNKPLGPSCGP